MYKCYIIWRKERRRWMRYFKKIVNMVLVFNRDLYSFGDIFLKLKFEGKLYGYYVIFFRILSRG